MEIVLLIARLLLAGVFGLAGAAKLADPRASRQAMVGFGVPEKLAAPLAAVLPYVEIAVALALLPVTTAWWGAAGALALLLIFTAAIGASLARGQAPDCRCFGQLHSAPVSWKTVARNLSLAALAGFVVWQGVADPGLSAVDWMTELTAAEFVNLLVGMVGITLLLIAVGYLRLVVNQQTKLSEKMDALKAFLEEDGELMPAMPKVEPPPPDGLPIGARAPEFSLAATSGGQVSLSSLLAEGKSLVLLFVGPHCWGCKMLLPMVRAWRRDHADRLNIVILSNGAPADVQAKMAQFEIVQALLDTDSAVADEYQAKWTPAAVLINPDGTVGSYISYGDNGIREWFRNLIASGSLALPSTNHFAGNGQLPFISTRYAVRKIGEPSPHFSLPDLSGRTVTDADLLGSPTLLIFWHPQCQFCRELRDELLQWENDPLLNSALNYAKLVFVSSGDAEEIRALNRNFKSLTLIDSEMDLAPLFGTKVTPSAILLDQHGRVSSSLAIGDQYVRALAGLRRRVGTATGSERASHDGSLQGELLPTGRGADSVLPVVPA